MKNYKLVNNITGWIVFAIAAFTFISTIEPTASFWDCGEFIASSFKLEVGHPPGAPLFMIIARLFSLFAGNDLSLVAPLINIMSALSSAFTSLFLFWTITHFAKKIVTKKMDGLNQSNILAIMASGVVGALLYTWSDTFWFSAVEGEVYAMSSFFTSVVFWAILKWEDVADEKHANRWIILIFYLIGLSVGVHLLNLLAIPAIVFVYYFRKYEVTKKGVLITSAIAMAILGGIMYVIIPHTVTVASWFDLLFVNSFGMSIHSGTFAFLILLAISLVGGIYYTHKKGKVVANTIILGVTVILIGYSSFAMIVIRSNANPPMDENNPDNVYSLLSYLNREQYGDRPLVYGQYYNAPIIGSENTFNYIEQDGKYKKIQWGAKYKYDARFETVFPRMYSQQANHVSAYKQWGQIKGKPITVNQYGQTRTLKVPTFRENIRYFFDYQMSHMYFRYFLWNFAGRQNDVQGHGAFNKGNWISGISFVDNPRVGSQDNLPDSLKKNKARNVFYFLPFILGLIGLFFQYIKNVKQFWVTLLFFLFTGVAIIVYLNQYPFQPRERDYAYVGSFYVFAIWIGLGVLGLFAAPSYLKNQEMKKMLFLGAGVAISSGLLALMFGAGTGFALMLLITTGIAVLILYLFKLALNPLKNNMVKIAVVSFLTLLVPIQMVGQTWDDHDRSERYTARDFARDYLDSCAPNAILFTNGDNDTFPLWYVQEVEGYRTDVRVVNLSLLNTEWYIDQSKRKAYDSEPVPFSMTSKQYMHGVREPVPFLNKVKGAVDIRQAIDFVKMDDTRYKVPSPYKQGEMINYFPSNKFVLPIDSAKIIEKGVVDPKDADKIVKEMEWTVKKQYVLKADLMVLDLIASFNWDRPVYFAITVGSDGYQSLEDYFQLEGLTYRLVPIKTPKKGGLIGRINTDIMYDNLMNKYKFGGLNNPNVYLDENNLRMTMNLRNNFTRLTDALLAEGKKEKALKVLDRCMDVMPLNTVPPNYFMIGIVKDYVRAGNLEKSEEIMNAIIDYSDQNLAYYLSLDQDKIKSANRDIQLYLYMLQEVMNISLKSGQEEVYKKVAPIMNHYGELFNTMASR